MDEFISTLQKLWPFLLVGVPAVYGAWQAWRNSSRVDRKDKLETFEKVEAASDTIIGKLRGEVERVHARLEEIEAEFSKFRRDHDTMIEAKEAKIALLEQKLELQAGECRNWQALAEAYERLLEANGIPHAKPSAPVWEINAGGLTTPLVADAPKPGDAGEG